MQVFFLPDELQNLNDLIFVGRIYSHIKATGPYSLCHL
uniref:Pco093185f n=1 Tax=Arundo donax TaxID=35708 RepID=A0A0A9EJK2_ARUDO